MTAGALRGHRTPPSREALALLPNARAVLTAERDPVAEFELLVRSVVDGLHARLIPPSS